MDSITISKINLMNIIIQEWETHENTNKTAKVLAASVSNGISVPS